jgi:hypothetical protein
MTARKIMEVFESAEELTEFFGGSIAKITYFARYIAINLNYRPDWLKPVRKLNEFPRYGIPKSAEDTILIPVVKRKHRLMAEDIVWIVERLSGRWELDRRGFRFEKLADAALFRVRL